VKQRTNTTSILQHPVAFGRSGFLVYFSLYVQPRFVFFILLLFIACFGLIGHLQLTSCSYKLGLTRQLLLRRLFFRLVLCCSHTRVQFYSSVCPIFLLFRCVAAFDVFICYISCILLRGRTSRMLAAQYQPKESPRQ
jgi:hypothetical protein